MRSGRSGRSKDGKLAMKADELRKVASRLSAPTSAPITAEQKKKDDALKFGWESRNYGGIYKQDKSSAPHPRA